MSSEGTLVKISRIITKAIGKKVQVSKTQSTNMNFNVFEVDLFMFVLTFHILLAFVKKRPKKYCYSRKKQRNQNCPRIKK